MQEEIIAKEREAWDPARGDFEVDYEPYKWDTIKTDFAGIAQDFGLSLREYRRVLLNMHILEKTVLKPYLGYAMARVMYFYCLVIKYKHPVEFSRAVFKHDENLLKDAIPKENYEQRAAMEAVNNSRLMYITDALMKGASGKIGSISFVEFKKTDESCQYDSALLNERWIGMGECNMDSNGNDYKCYSYVLYKTDCSNFDRIKNMTLLEHIYRQLEMFNMDLGGHMETKVTN